MNHESRLFPTDKSFCWQPIETAPKRILDGQDFLAGGFTAFGEWVVSVAYYGQHGDCYITVPLGYYVAAEDADGFPTLAPKITPTAWCDIPVDGTRRTVQ